MRRQLFALLAFTGLGLLLTFVFSEQAERNRGSWFYFTVLTGVTLLTGFVAGILTATVRDAQEIRRLKLKHVQDEIRHSAEHRAVVFHLATETDTGTRLAVAEDYLDKSKLADVERLACFSDITRSSPST